MKRALILFAENLPREEIAAKLRGEICPECAALAQRMVERLPELRDAFERVGLVGRAT